VSSEKARENRYVKAPPGPRGREVLGFFGIGSVTATIEFFERTARRYGPVSSFRILNRRIYLVDEADLIKEILVTQQHNFARDRGATLLRELVGDGLITREEPLHRERRRVLQPAFHRDQIAAYTQIMSAETARFCNALLQDRVIDLRKEMRRLTLSIAGTALFGADFRGSASQVASVLQRVLARSRWLAPLATFTEFVPLLYRRFFPRGPSLFFPRERKELEEIIAPIIQQRCAQAGKDVLSLLLAYRAGNDDPFTADDIRNEVVTFMLAGHETTASALTWAWYLIAQHPEVEEKLHAETDTVLGDREATIDDLARLPYTSMVFQEAMRLYPPALAFARRPKQSVVLGGYTIPPGVSVFVSPYVTQRNPRYFDRPERFDPERWQTISPPKFAYFPFGGGAKMCIGEPFAKAEGVVVLAMLAHRWRLASLDNSPIRPAPGMLLNPNRPILMRLIERPAPVLA
jgi:cytochrome P450